VFRGAANLAGIGPLQSGDLPDRILVGGGNHPGAAEQQDPPGEDIDSVHIVIAKIVRYNRPM
jgi:hypothetical protein